MTASIEPKLRHVALGGIIAILAASAIVAQPPANTPHYIGLTYIQTLPGKAADYRKFLETDAVKLAQAGVDDGGADAVYMLRLTAPYTTGSDYDYAQVVWYKDKPPLATTPRSVWEARAKKAGFANYQEFLDKRNALSKAVRSAWRTSIAHVGDLHVGNYTRAVSVKVDPEYRTDVLRFIETYTMSIAQSRMSAGQSANFGLSRPAALTTSDDEAGYSFSVAESFKDSDALLSGPGAMTPERFSKIFPGKNYATYINEQARLAPHRHNVTTRISEVVTLVGKLPVVTPAPVTP
jgi:hypothetical protein